VFRCSRRSDAENAEGSGEGKRDESLVSNHDDLPFVCRGVAPRLTQGDGDWTLWAVFPHDTFLKCSGSVSDQEPDGGRHRRGPFWGLAA
jgi:hypothetical protein